jgi:hypothetical protein
LGKGLSVIPKTGTLRPLRRQEVPAARALSSFYTKRRSLRFGIVALMAGVCLGAVSAYAQNATWNGATTDWNTPSNWNPATVPTGTARFANTGSTSVDNDSGFVAIGTILFTGLNAPNPGDPNAQAYTINVYNPFLVTGSGIINDSTNSQTFNVATSGGSGNTGNLIFQGNSSASGGTGAVIINNASGSFIFFQNNSTAGNATIMNNSIVEFNDQSTAGSANITNNIQMDFFDSTSAGSANITNAASATITFNTSATAGTAAIGNSGTLQFNNQSKHHHHRQRCNRHIQ